MLQLEDVQFGYDRAASYQFNLSVWPGTIAAVSGRSGSGKSTLLDLVAGFVTPVSGEIYWTKKALTELPPDKRPITTLFQRNNLFEHRSAVDNVLVGIDPKLPATGPSVERAHQALQSVGLAKQASQRASTLSGGQQQRVAIARALVRSTPLILLDEPFSALDQVTRSDMLQLVRNIVDTQNRTVVMVTHDINDCDLIANSHYTIEDGVLNKLR